MRKASLLFVTLVVAAFAVTTDLGEVVPRGATSYLPVEPNGFLDVLYSTGDFDSAFLNGTATAPANGWVSADDFVFENDSTIEYLRTYIINLQATPDDFPIRFWNDTEGSGPGSEIDNAPSSCVLTSTGQYAFGYLVWEAEMTTDVGYDIDAGHYWWACGFSSGFWYMMVKAHDQDYMEYFDYGGGGSGPWYSSQSMWGTAYEIYFTIEGTTWSPGNPPYVDGMDPDDGDSGVPVDTDIVFHCVCDMRPVDTDTIVFTVEDQSRRLGGGALHPGSSLPALQGNPHPTGEISGTLEIDDSDPYDVVCTFTPDEDLPVDLITCTVDGCLANDRGHEMGDDFIWAFSTGDYGVEETTWGAIKAEF
ncbi:hypothetical protein KAU45_07220 [bacterium]|nr:hypothetical protein [bacterium]